MPHCDSRVVSVVVLVWLSLFWTTSQAYDYPFADPYVATIAGTPETLQAALPRKVRVKEFRLPLLDGREVPEVLWYDERLRYSLVAQKKKAPLVFVIAGTGSSYNAPNMRVLQKALYTIGFHVVALSSSTHPNFIVAASGTHFPGHLEDDARDLYRVMKQTLVQIGKRIEVSAFHLAGYSLGAAQAGFIAQLDETEQDLNFQRVLMINPPVDLRSSVVRLDRMFEENIPGGLDNFDVFFDETIAAFTDVYRTGDFVEFNDDLLFATYEKYRPDSSRLAAIIGLAFRLASANMLFTSDIMTRSGFIVPASRSLSTSDSVTDYFKVSAQSTFIDYFEGMLLPSLQKRYPGMTADTALASMSLKTIESYLRRSTKVGLMANEDDIILGPGELDYLRDVFGTRAMIYPTGGHLGNLAFAENIAYIIDFFRQ